MRKNKIKIFVTGANGCIGHVLVKRLNQLQYEVVALALNDNDTKNIIDIKDIKIEYGDICDKQVMNKILSKYTFDCVLHLAAIVHRRHIPLVQYLKINYEATKNLFNLSQRNGVKQFILLSTVAVYGSSTIKSVNEKGDIHPESDYAVSKVKAENFLMQSKYKNLKYTIIRSTTVYGPKDKGNINKLFHMAQRGFVPVMGDGQNLKSIVFVDNLVDVLTKVILNPRAYNQIFNVSDDSPYSFNQIVKTMEIIMGRKVFIMYLPYKMINKILQLINKAFLLLMKRKFYFFELFNKMNTNNMYDISKVRKLLQYHPKYNLKQGLKKLYG